MKKIFLFLFALATTLYVNAQTTNITLQVDITKYLGGGATVAGAGMRIAGTFQLIGASVNGVPMAEWSPSDTTAKLTDLGNNIWATTITISNDTLAKGTDTLFFKFINGTWGTGFNEDNPDDTLETEGCAFVSGTNSGNRIFPLISSVGSTYQWCYDHCAQCDGSPALLNPAGVRTINNVSVFTLAPNPAVNKQSTLMYSVSQYSPVNISLYNVLGQSVKTFVNTNRPSGIYNQPINLSGLNSGIYFIQLTSGNQAVTRKITVQ